MHYRIEARNQPPLAYSGLRVPAMWESEDFFALTRSLTAEKNEAFVLMEGDSPPASFLVWE
jgi:hypothetical protein